MKFINKSKLYKLTSLVTPPFIFIFIKKTSFYKYLKIFINKHAKEEIFTKWVTINSGPLKGREIYIEENRVWGEMINGKYDHFINKYLQRINLKDAVIFDVGAHFGYSSFNFACMVGEKGKVISFEPNAKNIERFELNLTKNKDLSSIIKKENLAISDKDSIESFVFSDKVDDGTSSGGFIDRANTFWEKNIYEEKIGFKRVDVTTTTIDNYEKENNLKPSLIKIDIEGAEYLALRGANKTLKEIKPILLIEIHSIYNMYEVQNILNNNSYSIEIINEEKDGRCYIAAEPKK